MSATISLQVPPTPSEDCADDERLVRIIDAISLEWITYIEPANDSMVHIYASVKTDQVVMGDVIYYEQTPENNKGFDADGMAWYEVTMATTKRIAFRRDVPYMLFVQMQRITDEERLRTLRKDYRELMQLPF